MINLEDLVAEINAKIVEAAQLAQDSGESFTITLGTNTVSFQDGYWDGYDYNNDWYSSSADC